MDIVDNLVGLGVAFSMFGVGVLAIALAISLFKD
jgi:hypothetical protein